MPSSADNLLQSCLASVRDVVAPGSIEETSITAAATMLAQGQKETAHSIISALLLDDAVKQHLLICFGLVEDTQDSPEPPAAPASPQPLPQDPVEPPTPTPDPVPPTPPVSMPEPAPENSPITVPQPTSPPVPTPAPVPPAPQPVVVPEAPSPVIEEPLAPNPPTESPIIETPPAPAQQSPSDIWANFNAIVDEIQVEDDSSEALLKKALSDQEAEDESQLTATYDAVFKDDQSHTSNYEVPGIIKTYEEAADVTEREKEREEQARATKVLKAQPFFDRVEAYLKKAYELGNESTITSARNQFASLRDRYPYYVEDRAAHVAEIQALIDQHETSLKENAAAGSMHTDFPVQQGMRITGEQHTYTVQAIEDNDIVFVPEEGHIVYRVPRAELLKALHEETIQPDTFFERYRR